MSIGSIVRGCAVLATTLTLSSAALADASSSGKRFAADYYSYNEPPTPNWTAWCPDSHGVRGNGYRDELGRLPESDFAVRPYGRNGVAEARGYRDQLARFPYGRERYERYEVGGPAIATRGYRDSLARFPGTVIPETPRNAVARCGRLDVF